MLLGLVMAASSSRGDTSASAPDSGSGGASAVQLWNSSATYEQGAVVAYAGAFYTALAPSTDVVPSSNSSLWQPLNPSSGAAGAFGNLTVVRPEATCVVPDSEGSASFTGVFGYYNTGHPPVFAPVSAVPGPEENAFASLAPVGQGQPVAFEPGLHSVVFAVHSTGAPITWTLGTHTATASPGMTQCSTTMGPDGPLVGANGTSILVQPNPTSILTAATPASPAQTVVGATPGGLQVTSDGAATYSIPLWTPPAIMGMGPSLALSYSSRAGRGLLGLGWNLAGFGISRITRCHTTVAEDGDANPVDFSGANNIFCLDGQRLMMTNDPAVNGKQVFQTERDPFTRILFDANAQNFEVDTRDGTVLSYGTTTASRHTAPLKTWVPGDNGAVPGGGGDLTYGTYAWALDTVQDTSGNEMTISYGAFGNIGTTLDDKEALAPASCTELLPETISYTQGPGRPALRSVSFTYEAPATPEPSCQYVNGFGVGAEALLQAITMSGPATTSAPVTLHTYTMTYQQSATTNHSLLSSVQECGSASNCKPPTTFNYSSPFGGTGATATTTFAKVPGALSALYSIPNPSAPANDIAPGAFQFSDLNGDGKDDVIFSVWNWSDPSVDSPTDGWYMGYALSDGTAFRSPQIYAVGWTVATETHDGYPLVLDNAIDGTIEFDFGLSHHFVAKPTINPEDGLQAFNINLINNTIVNTDSWGGRTPFAPYFVTDLDGNGDVDIITSDGSSGWLYWLSDSPASQFSVGTSTFGAGTAGTVSKSLTPMTDPARSLTTTDSNPQLFDYVAQLDGTGKTAFLFRQGTTNSSGAQAEDLNLVSVVASATTGLLSSQETSLPVGPRWIAQASSNPSCTGGTSGFAGLIGICANTRTFVPNAFHYIFIDLNGDGNAEAIQVPNAGGAPLGVALNTGAGFGPVTALPSGQVQGQPYSFPAVSADANGVSPTPGVVQVSDINGDGLPDLLIANNMNATDIANDPVGGPITAYVSRGAAGLSPQLLVDVYGDPILQGGGDTQEGLPDNCLDANGNTIICPQPYGVSTLDFDGDGVADIFANGNIYVHSGNKPDLLTTITDGLGKITSVDYAMLGRDSATVVPQLGTPLYTPATNCQYPIQCLVKGMSVVGGYAVTGDLEANGKQSPGEGWSGATFSYGGGMSDVKGRGWLGFLQVDSVDGPTGAETFTSYYPPSPDTGYGYPLAGVVKYQTANVSTVAGQATQRVTASATTYDVIPTLAGRGAVIRPNGTSSTVVEANASASYSQMLSHVATQYGYDSTTAPFNLNARTTTWYLSGETDVWGATYTSPNTSNGKWLLGLLQTTTETSNVPGQTSVTRTHSYDPDPNTGLLMDETVEPNATPDLTSKTTYQRLADGQVYHVSVSATDPFTDVPISRESWITYDSFDGAFPATLANGIGQMTRMVFHPGFGVMAFSEDQNGVETHSTIDPLGRKTSLAHDGLGTVTITYEPGQPYKEATTGPIPGLFTIEGSVAGGSDTWITYNSLGNEVARGARNHDGTSTYVETSYTGVIPGQVASVANPHAYGVTPVLTTYAYDNMGRVTTTTLPDKNVVQSSYVGLAATTIDPRGYARTQVADERGRTAHFDEDSQQWPSYPQTAPYVTPATAISTSYAYGPFGVVNGVAVTARASSGGVTTALQAMTYDALGRRVSLVDADNGASSASYNAFSDTTSAADANGNIHIPTYDVLGRIVADYSSLDGTTSYQWDTAPYGVGKLASATSGDNVTTSYEYFPNGLSASSTWTIPGYGAYTLSTPRDTYGRVAQVQYPNGAGIATLGYDQIGAVSSANIDGQPSVLLWQANTWQADGRITQESYGVEGDGDWGVTTRSYDPNRGWLTGIATAGAAAVQQLSYPSYDANGNVTARYDGLTGTTETFTNDFLNRLQTWKFNSASATTLTTFGYDDLGNLSGRASISNTAPSTETAYASGTRDAAGTPGTAGVHAVTSVGGDSYLYDAKGNQTAWQPAAGSGRSIAYTSFDLPHSVTTGAGTTTFLYDANHQRVVKDGPDGTTVYVPGVYEHRIVAGTTSDVCYVPGADRVVAQTVQQTSPNLGPPTVYYLHDDSLGSVESITGVQQAFGTSAITYTTLPTQHLKYDPFGQRIDPSQGLPTTVVSQVTAGFTSQEHDDDLGSSTCRGACSTQRSAGS